MSRTLKDTCFADLKQRILSTDLAPGAPLDEVKLAAHYQISRTPMREVLQRLTGAGYAEHEENRGAKVAPMDVTTLRVFFQTAPMVYANIGKLAAEYHTATQLKDLRQTQARFCQSMEARDVPATALANHRFHEIIGEMSRNPYLVAALSRLQIDHTRLSHTFYSPVAPDEHARAAKARTQHDEMIDAIAARDPERMIELTLKHWDLSKDRLEQFVSPEILPITPSDLERHHAV